MEDERPLSGSEGGQNEEPPGPPEPNEGDEDRPLTGSEGAQANPDTSQAEDVEAEAKAKDEDEQDDD